MRDASTQTEISFVNSWQLIEQTGHNKNEVAGTIQRDKKCIKGSEEPRLENGEFGHGPEIQSRSVHGYPELQ